MQHWKFTVALGVSLLAGASLSSCGSDDGRPVRPPTPTTPTPTAPALSRIEILVPSSLAPGESVRLTANARFSDNSVQDVTGQAVWRSSNTQVVSIAPEGVATALSPGETVIGARYQGRDASTSTLVLPTGTFRLTGSILDDGFGVSNATVTVVSGVGEGLSATTDAGGRYALYGVRDLVRLQVKRDGYLNRLEELAVTANRSFDVTLVRDRAPRELGGDYVVTFTFNKQFCSPSFPDSRSYAGHVTQDGPRLDVRLSGADFVVTAGHGNGFTGFQDADGRVSFSLGASAYYYYYYYGPYDVIERVSSSSVLVINGRVTSEPTANGLSGVLEGALLMAQGNTPPFTRISASCYSNSHRVELRRQ